MPNDLNAILMIFARELENIAQGSVVNCPAEQTTQLEENWIQEINHRMTDAEIEKKAKELSRKVNEISTHERIYSPIFFKERGVEEKTIQTPYIAANITGKKIEGNKIQIRVRTVFVPK